MPTFYVTTLIVRPEPPSACSAGRWTMLPRAWSVGITDWAFLATSPHHEIRVEYQLADLLARGCNMELSVEAEDMETARQLFRPLYVSLLQHGVAPFFAPFICTHSINDFSAISAPPESLTDSRAERAARLRHGDECVVLGWNEAHLGSLHTPTDAVSEVPHDTFVKAGEYAEEWSALVQADGSALVLQETLISAPQIPSHGQSIMQIWSGLEALFPHVSAELSFRLALYLTQMIQPSGDRRAQFEKIRTSYKVRSAIAHGSRRRRNVSDEREEWTTAWEILAAAARATASRSGVPTEDALTGELLGGPAA